MTLTLWFILGCFAGLVLYCICEAIGDFFSHDNYYYYYSANSNGDYVMTKKVRKSKKCQD